MIYLACVIAPSKSAMEESEASLWQIRLPPSSQNAISESRLILEKLLSNKRTSQICGC